MKKLIHISAMAILCICALLLLTGCEDDPVEKFIVANEAYATADAMEAAAQPEALRAGETVYASISFIESPKGMKYAVEWLLDGTQVFAEEKEMETDKRGIIVYELPGDKATAGQLALRVLYKGKLIFEKGAARQVSATPPTQPGPTLKMPGLGRKRGADGELRKTVSGDLPDLCGRSLRLSVGPQRYGASDGGGFDAGDLCGGLSGVEPLPGALL